MRGGRRSALSGLGRVSWRDRGGIGHQLSDLEGMMELPRRVLVGEDFVSTDFLFDSFSF